MIKLREYKKDSKQYKFYKTQHETQNYDYVTNKIKKYSKLNNDKMTMKKALLLMDNFIDPSDPDVDLPNSYHAYQTAERIRKKYPLDYELQITGLIHDLGKVLFQFGENSTSVVGDTFVVGCAFPKSIVFSETFNKNKDYNNTKYNTKNGIYKEKCGIDNLVLSFGHDEYLYIVLKNNKNHKLSEKYWNIIRYHSFYPWHSSNSYSQFMIKKDEEIKKEVLLFNIFDLYSKEDTDFILTDDIINYYDKILDEYFPEELKW